MEKPTRLNKKYNKYPYLFALPTGENKNIAKVWCPYCKSFHYHGWVNGHRNAHCELSYSEHKCSELPFDNTGYILFLPSKKELVEIRNDIDRYLSKYYK